MALRFWNVKKITIADGDIMGLTTIDEVVARLVVVSEILGCEVSYFYNQVPLTIEPGMTEREVVAAYTNYKRKGPKTKKQ